MSRTAASSALDAGCCAVTGMAARTQIESRRHFMGGDYKTGAKEEPGRPDLERERDTLGAPDLPSRPAVSLEVRVWVAVAVCALPVSSASFLPFSVCRS